MPLQPNPSNMPIQCNVLKLNIQALPPDNTGKTKKNKNKTKSYIKYKKVQKKFEFGKIEIEFFGKVNANLKEGEMYFDGKNYYLAVNQNKIKNLFKEIKGFCFPTEVILIQTDYQDGSETSKSEFKKWLSELKWYKQVSPLLYFVYFNGNFCFAKVQIIEGIIEVELKPFIGFYDVGKSKMESIILNFKN